jgi:predicted ATPase
VAEALQEHFAETVQTQPELLANHFTEAGLIEQAIPYWQSAGQRAMVGPVGPNGTGERSANREAIRHLSKGLELVNLLPQDSQHLQQELALQVALGTALSVARGFASLEARSAWARALKICQQVDQSPLAFLVYWAHWLSNAAGGKQRQAREAGEECLRLARAAGDRALLMESHHALGVSLLLLGEFAQGLKHLEEGAAIYDPAQHAPLAFVYGQDSGVACLCHGAWALWFLGYPDQARRRLADGLTLADTLSHPVSKAAAANLATWVYQLLRDRDAAREQADAAVALSTEREFEFWRATGVIGQGWAMAQEGPLEDGIARLRAGLKALRSTGGEVLMPYFLGLLAQALTSAERNEEALDVLAESEAALDESGEAWWQAELYRLKGEFLLRADATNERGAEEFFRKAMATARSQSAKSLELRAAMSLGRVLLRRGEQTEAKHLLAGVYGWFTEGFNTPDLQEAKALIDQT